MRRAVVQPGSIAPVAELVAETGIGERAPKIIDEVRKITARRRIDHQLKRGQDRQE